ncbi:MULTISPECIES: hypothetical protein [Bradyrhizobium]|jgi:hypothetical protein|uniref:Uncharacterized protein n=2 Tax=Bradyrhizobium TaxID=374 RepID=A0ABY0PC46_9BRAD|nr:MULTISPECIES: hypothetical protein [Bradyrhizobium]SDI06658.1 hypothetical protein SAMN05444163_1795 [Bradyrhizobium ottawaense]SED84609.1 hypothetical protein SAMN05444171_5376 [Bradyrhizobium lablabi]SHL80627.1 hypothetical protein SAMN05444321_4162 [Bradyrhizobium lablabi]
MVLRSAVAAVLCTGFLAVGGVAVADEYRPSEFLGLDLSRAVLSPKRLGPETEFAPIPIEAKSDRAQADTDASVWPKLPARKPHLAKPQMAKPEIAKSSAEPPRAAARTRLAHRHGNPLDAQARDTRIQTWPCKSGGICGWQR